MFSIFNYMCQMLCISEIDILASNEIRFYTYSTDSLDFLKMCNGIQQELGLNP